MEAATVQQILDSAEQAAASGDYSSAEALLREAAHLQESSLGPHHPDLASTFNNLAVVCEKSNKLAAAEEFYARAFSIAFASLDSEDPLVTTSRENLDDFRRIHAVPDAAAAPSAVNAPAQSVDVHSAAVDAPSTSSPDRRLLLVAGAVMGIVLLGTFAIWLIRTPSAPNTGQDEAAAASGQEIGSAAPSAVSRAIAPSRRRATENPLEETPRVVEASLCQSLSTTGGRWECTPPGDSSAPGPLIFYTRIAAPQGTRVHHRWYRNGSLRRDVSLAVDANPSTGYRTYSRQQVDGGEWRVELVTEDGVILREERVAIQ
jgi:hypothetical protein